MEYRNLGKAGVKNTPEGGVPMRKRLLPIGIQTFREVRERV